MFRRTPTTDPAVAAPEAALATVTDVAFEVEEAR